MTTFSKWFVPGVGLALGLVVGVAEMGRSGNPVQATVAFALVAGYALLLRAFQSRSDMASLLSGVPRDERWTSINVRALAVAAQVMALAVAIGFLATQFGGGDTETYARLGAIFAVAYIGGLVWYRSRS